MTRYYKFNPNSGSKHLVDTYKMWFRESGLTGQEEFLYYGGGDSALFDTFMLVMKGVPVYVQKSMFVESTPPEVKLEDYM